MRKDLVRQDVDFRVDFRSDRIVLPAAMFRRRRKIAHGILHKRSSAKVIIEHGTTKGLQGERVPSAALVRKMSRLGLKPGMMKVEVA